MRIGQMPWNFKRSCIESEQYYADRFLNSQRTEGLLSLVEHSALTFRIKNCLVVNSLRSRAHSRETVDGFAEACHVERGVSDARCLDSCCRHAQACCFW